MHSIRVFPGGKKAVFFGTVKGDGSPHLHLLDIPTGAVLQLAPGLPIAPSTIPILPLAISPDGQSVLIDLPSGDLHRIVAIPKSGSGRTRTVIVLTSEPYAFDAAPDGTLYVDQVSRPP
jgi:hypothetical protein